MFTHSYCYVYVFLLLCLCILIVMFIYSYCYVYVFLLCLCILIVMFMYFYCYVCVFLLLCLCIFIVMFMYYYYYVYVFLLLCMFCSVYSVSLCCSMYCSCVNVYCTVLLPPGVNPIAVNKYIISCASHYRSLSPGEGTSRGSSARLGIFLTLASIVDCLFLRCPSSRMSFQEHFLCLWSPLVVTVVICPQFCITVVIANMARSAPTSTWRCELPTALTFAVSHANK